MANETAARDLAGELARAETKLREAVAALKHIIRAYETGGMTAAIERAEASVSEADRPKQWITGPENVKLATAAPVMLEALKFAQEAFFYYPDASKFQPTGSGGRTVLDVVNDAAAQAEPPKQWITGHVSGAYSPDLDQL